MKELKPLLSVYEITFLQASTENDFKYLQSVINTLYKV